MPLSASSSAFAPFLIEPRFVGRVWGFNDLRPWYDFLAGDEPIGEVWLTGDECRAATGTQAGKTLGHIFAEFSEAMLGPKCVSDAHFSSPLLLKVILAKEKLSVQVHPDDAMAQKYGEPRGKTECWYVLDADKGAELALGLKPGVTMDAVRSGIHNGTLEESLNLLPIVKDDMVFVDAGTVHAIWPGSVLLETQQYSDTTYRMYDYGRPRELHIEKSIEATRLKTRAGKIPPQVLADRTVLIAVEYFRVERMVVSGSRASATLPAGDELAHSLSYLFAANGSARIHSTGSAGPGFEAFEIPTRGIAAIPAASPEFVVEDLGSLDLIRVAPSWPEQKA